jgi:hypothetical protein
MRAGLEELHSGWWLQRLFNMSTITREWVALQHAHLMPFADSLLRGTASARRAAPVEMDIPPGMAAAMESQCNGSQARAGRHAGAVEFAAAACLGLRGPSGRRLLLLELPAGREPTVPPAASLAHFLQMTALRAGLDGTPLVLIQGPPGTGKVRRSAGKGASSALAVPGSTSALNASSPPCPASHPQTASQPPPPRRRRAPS